MRASAARKSQLKAASSGLSRSVRASASASVIFAFMRWLVDAEVFFSDAEEEKGHERSAATIMYFEMCMVNVLKSERQNDTGTRKRAVTARKPEPEWAWPLGEERRPAHRLGLGQKYRMRRRRTPLRHEWRQVCRLLCRCLHEPLHQLCELLIFPPHGARCHSGQKRRKIEARFQRHALRASIVRRRCLAVILRRAVALAARPENFWECRRQQTMPRARHPPECEKQSSDDADVAHGRVSRRSASGCQAPARNGGHARHMRAKEVGELFTGIASGTGQLA